MERLQVSRSDLRAEVLIFIEQPSTAAAICGRVPGPWLSAVVVFGWPPTVPARIGRAGVSERESSACGGLGRCLCVTLTLRRNAATIAAMRHIIQVEPGAQPLLDFLDEQGLEVGAMHADQLGAPS